MKEYILAIDQGTSTTRAIIIDRQGNYIGTASQKFEQLVPQSGWVEQDPNVIWQSVCTVLRSVLTAFSKWTRNNSFKSPLFARVFRISVVKSFIWKSSFL